MSIYHKAEDDEIDIDGANREVDIYVTSDDQGSIYLTLTFQQIHKIFDEVYDWETM